MIKPTHRATNKKTGEKVLVEFNPSSGEYKQSWMVCLKNPDTDWDLEPIESK